MIMLKIIIFVLVSLVISYLFGCGLAGLIGRSIYDNIDGVCFRIVTERWG